MDLWNEFEVTMKYNTDRFYEKDSEIAVLPDQHLCKAFGIYREQRTSQIIYSWHTNQSFKINATLKTSFTILSEVSFRSLSALFFLPMPSYHLSPLLLLLPLPLSLFSLFSLRFLRIMKSSATPRVTRMTGQPIENSFLTSSFFSRGDLIGGIVPAHRKSRD